MSDRLSLKGNGGDTHGGCADAKNRAQGEALAEIATLLKQLRDAVGADKDCDGRPASGTTKRRFAKKAHAALVEVGKGLFEP